MVRLDSVVQDGQVGGLSIASVMPVWFLIADPITGRERALNTQISARV